MYLFPLLAIADQRPFRNIHHISHCDDLTNVSRAKNISIEQREAAKNRALNNNEVRLIDFLLRRLKTNRKSPGPVMTVDAQEPNVALKSHLLWQRVL